MNSLHPNVMRHELLRRASFERLYRTHCDYQKLNVLLDSERDELSTLNVPLFWRLFEEEILRDSQGRPLQCRMPSARSVVRRQISGIDESEVTRQSSLIRRLFGERLSAETNKSVVGYVFSPIETSLQIAGKIQNAAARRGSDLYWLCSMSVRERELTWSAGVLDVYSGQLGIALYMALASKLFSSTEFRNTAINAIDTVSRWSSNGVQNMHTLGIFTGALGYTYVLANVGILLDRPDVFEAALIHLEKLDFKRYRDDLDVIGGSAGAILFLANLRAHPSLLADSCDLINDRMDQCASRLVRSVKTISGQLTWRSASTSTEDIGFAHGTAGIAAALCVAGRSLNRPDLFDLAASAVARESKEWGEKYGYMGGSSDIGHEVPPRSWCRGLTGLIQGRALCLENLPETHASRSMIFDDCNKFIRIFGELSDSDNASLCHGFWGDQMTLRKVLREVRLNPLGGILPFSHNPASQEPSQNILCGDGIYSHALHELFSPGLLTGSAGIAWGMSASCFEVPNVLTLELAK